MRERMTLRQWYGNSIWIPMFSSTSYPNFAGSCLGIVSSIMERYVGQVDVHFNNVATASADRPNGRININSKFLYGEFRDGLFLNSENTLSVIAGLIAHEAGHFAFSPDDLSAAAEFIKENTSCFYNEQVACGISNIIEDIFIEAEIEKRVPSLSWTLETMNDLLVFPVETMESVLEAAALQEDHPKTMQEVSTSCNAILIAKVLDRVDSTPYINNIFSLARSATETNILQERYKLSLAIYDSIMKDITEEECKTPKASDLIEELLDMIRGITAPHDGKGEEKEEKTAASEQGGNAVKHAMDKLKDCVVTMTGAASEPGFSPTTLFIEKTPALAATAVEADKRYQRLAEVGRQRAVVNRPYGENRTRGNHIRQLSRIITDNKIFSEPLAVRLAKPMQVMIVVDCSSSMAGEEIHSACKAALGAANGLAEARCEVGVFGHTADLLGGTDVTIYRFKDFNEPISVLPFRLQALLEGKGGLRLSQNRDSYAIQYLSNKLRNTRLRRLMIVISDGAPQAREYGGAPAINHARKVVEETKKKGVEVMSISITTSARAANRIIYGGENDVYNEDPNVIEQIVRRLITT